MPYFHSGGLAVQFGGALRRPLAGGRVLLDRCEEPFGLLPLGRVGQARNSCLDLLLAL